ncbi:MAG: hypothetical protein KAH62_01120 [Desulfobacula sp.]|nr:hypothetical protein [Desulfobacula sp.]
MESQKTDATKKHTASEEAGVSNQATRLAVRAGIKMPWNSRTAIRILKSWVSAEIKPMKRKAYGYRDCVSPFNKKINIP